MSEDDNSSRPPGWNPSFETRFQSGRSGNPRGRRATRSVDDGSISAILARQVLKKDSRNKSKAQTYEQAIHNAIIKKANQGDIRALEIVHKEKSRELLCGGPPISETKPKTLSKIMDEFASDLWSALGQFALSVKNPSEKQTLKEAARKLGKLGPEGSKSWINHMTVQFGLGWNIQNLEGEEGEDDQ